MNTKILLVCLVAILATTGSTCLNDEILIPLNLPLSGCYTINSGTNLHFSGRDTIRLADQIDQQFAEDIQAGRLYDIRVHVLGNYDGTVSGIGLADGVPFMTYGGVWDSLHTPRSLLTDTLYIQHIPAGLSYLSSVLVQFIKNPETRVILSTTGSVSRSPVPEGLQVCIEVFTQVDTDISGGD